MLVVLRGQAQISVSIKPDEDRSIFDSASSLADTEKNLVPELGIIGLEVDAKIAAAATGLRDPYGIIVVARAAGAASEVPILPRDIIRSVNDRRIVTLEALREDHPWPEARRTGDAADSARRQADVRVVHV